MAHFAEIDENNIVLRVTVVDNNVLKDENGIEQEYLGLEHLKHLGGKWVQTSYNKNFRKNYAGPGYTYDKERDAFIPPKQYASWVFNEDTCNWDPPVLYPIDEKIYSWNESTISWEEIVLE